MLRSSVRSLRRLHDLCPRQVRHQSRLASSLLNGPKTGGSLMSLVKLTAAKPAIYAADLRSIHVGPIRNAKVDESLDQSLHRIDNEIRRTGRINRRELEEILEDVRQLQSMTSNQSLMIIRCCGDLVPEENFENRTKLVQEVWKLMDKLKVPLDISHYNALLRVYLENEYKFNPSEFLQELSTKGLEPNRVTYQRLIARFCQEGDIDGASTILQHMKEKQLPINVHVFNALILGHAHAGDMESAEGILSVMRQAGLEPNDDSYATLMRGYAKNGDLANIRRIVAECEEKDIYLLDRDFLEVIFTLVASNHKDLAKEIIPFIKRHAGFNHEITNVVLRLVTIGHEDAAFELVKEMPRAMRHGDEELPPSGNFFLRQLVNTDSVPPEKILKICHEMVTSKLNKHALLRATEFALENRKFEKAFDFIEALKESGFPIRQHFFWPFFATSKTEQDVYYGLKCMSYMGIHPTIETLRDYIIPALLSIPSKGTKSYEHILEKLSNYTTIPASTVVPAALQYILQHSEFETAAKFALKYRVRFNHHGIRRALIDAYHKSHDAKAFVDIVASAGFDDDDSAREAMGTVLLDFLESCRGQNTKANLLKPILEECLSHGLGLSNSTLELIQNNLGEELTPDLSNLIMKLASGDLSLRSSYFAAPGKHFIALENKSTEELEGMLAAATESGASPKGVQKALLINYGRERQTEKAEALYNKLNDEKFIFTAGIYAILLDMYCETNQLEKAKEMQRQIASREFFVLDDLKLLRYAHLLMSNNLDDECIEFLKTQPRDEARTPQGVHQVAIVWKILNSVAEKGDVEKVKEVFRILKDRGLTPVNNVVLGPIVKAHLVKEDLDGALNEFETCVNEYSVTPWKFELLCRFIKADDAERLQRVVDLSTKLHGEINSLYDLTFAFIECGKIRQAKKIVETPGFRARNEKLEYICQQYLDAGKVDELEKLVEITRDVFNVDRNSLYLFLLKAYCKQDDASKALSVWTSLQEENVQPSDDFMIHLANFLKEKNLDVPFEVPENKKAILVAATQPQPPRIQRKDKVRIESRPELESDLDPVTREFRSYLQNDEIDKALEFHNRLEVEGKSLGVVDTSRLIGRLAGTGRLGEATRLTNQMFQNGTYPHPRQLRYYVDQLAKAGDIDTLQDLDSKLNADMKRLVMLNTRLCTVYVDSGRGLEYFEKFIKPKALKQSSIGEALNQNELIPVSAALHILNRHPELKEEFAALEPEIKDARNKVNIHTILWLTSFREKNYDEAQKRFETHLKSEDPNNLKILPILKDARENKDEEMLMKVSEFMMSLEGLEADRKGDITSTHIEILCATGKTSEALVLLQNQISSGVIKLSNVRDLALRLLKSEAELAKLHFPHQIPTSKKRKSRRVKEDSSDSSSSDSDRE